MVTVGVPGQRTVELWKGQQELDEVWVQSQHLSTICLILKPGDSSFQLLTYTRHNLKLFY